MGKKGLLLGNGINACIGITELTENSIHERFISNVVIYSPIIKSVFNVDIHEDFMSSINIKLKSLGIEALAGKLYDYVKKAKTKWTVNDECRLQDLVACIGMASVFYTVTGQIDKTYDASKLPSMEEYDYVFTLNYTEFWDFNHKCIYLHGYVDLTQLRDAKNAILVSKDRMCANEYSNAVNEIRKKHSIIEFSPNDVVFAPTNIDKKQLICVYGLYPFENFYPADDLFLYPKKELYEDLTQVDELDIFGMSPFGDDDIIDVINNIKKVSVYVYDKNNNLIETEAWKSKLKINDVELKDSNEIKKYV